MDTTPTDAPATDEGAGTLPVRVAALRDLRAGVAGYRHFRDRLLDEISPEEAEAAERESRRGRRALGGVVAAFLALALLRELIDPFAAPGAYLAAGDTLFGAALLAALWLSGTRRMPYAARVVFPLVALFAVPPSLSHAPVEHLQAWGPVVDLIGILGAAAAAIAVGVIVDGAAPLRRGAALDVVTTGLAVIALQTLRWTAAEPTGPYPWGTVLAGGAYVLWPVVRRVVPTVATAGSGASPDVDTLLSASWLRWRSLTFGRFMALALGVPAFFLFLQNLGLPDALEPVDDTDVARFRLRSDDAARVALFWRQEGRLLRESDFEEARLFVPDDREMLAAFSQRLAADPLDASLAAELDVYLQPRRAVYERGQLRDDIGYEPLLYESHPLRPTLERPAPAAFHRMRRLDFRALETVYPDSAANTIAGVAASQWSLLAFGIIGLIVLWRRGGDSPTARWAGIWLVSIAAIATYWFGDYYLPGLRFTLWEHGLRSSTGAAVSRVVVLLESTVIVLQAVTVLMLPISGLWTHVCWPTAYDPARPTWWHGVVVAAKIAAVTSIAVFCVVGTVLVTETIGSLFRWPDFGTVVGPILLFLLLNALLFGVGAFLRRQTAERSEVRRLGVLPILAFVATEVVLLLVIVGAAGDDVPFASVAVAASRVAAVVFFALAALALLRQDFLRVSAGKDMSFVLLVLLLPVALEIAERAANLVVEQTGLFPAAAGPVVSLFLVVSFLAPMQRAIARLLRYVVVRRLRAIEGRVAAVVEDLVGVESCEALGERLARVFDELGVEAYGFYAREADGGFTLLVHDGVGSDAPPRRIALSDHVREMLSRERSFLDLEVVPYEWPHFFHQFELGRLQRDTGARYVLPVCLKSSLRGLLLLPPGRRHAELARDQIAGEMNDLGIATVQVKR